MSKERKTPEKTRMVGYVLVFAIVIEVVALIFAGFVVALFGLFMFFLGYFVIPLGFMTDREGWLTAMPTELQDKTEVSE